MGCHPSKVNRTEIRIIAPPGKPEMAKRQLPVKSSPIHVPSDEGLLPNATDITDITDAALNDVEDHVTGPLATRFNQKTSALSWSRHVEMPEMTAVKNGSKLITENIGLSTRTYFTDLLTSKGECDKIDQTPKPESPTDEFKTDSYQEESRNLWISETNKFLISSDTWLPNRNSDSGAVSRLNLGAECSLNDPCLDGADPEESPLSKDSQYYSQDVGSWSPQSGSLSSFLAWSELSILEDTSGSMNSLSIDDPTPGGSKKSHQRVTRGSRPHAAIRRHNVNIMEAPLSQTARF